MSLVSPEAKLVFQEELAKWKARVAETGLKSHEDLCIAALLEFRDVNRRRTAGTGAQLPLHLDLEARRAFAGVMITTFNTDDPKVPIPLES